MTERVQKAQDFLDNSTKLITDTYRESMDYIKNGVDDIFESIKTWLFDNTFLSWFDTSDTPSAPFRGSPSSSDIRGAVESGSRPPISPSELNPEILGFYNPGQEHGMTTETKDSLVQLGHVIGEDINVTSGYRSPFYNRRVGGASRSRHMHGDAADIDVSGMSNRERVLVASIASL